MKILHSADFHLDTPFQGRTAEETAYLKQALLSVPAKVAKCRREEGCDLVLLAGDLFDGAPTRASIEALQSALEEMEVPVFIAPGNHDFLTPDSPYLTRKWPKNVHIFTSDTIQSVVIPELDCRIYGAGYKSMDCRGLLEGFHIQGDEKYHVAVLHGDPTQLRSPYCPVTARQVEESGLDYLALGHIHAGGSFRAGETLCAWPGSPMGRGYDELNEKGVLVTALKDTATARFEILDTARFFDMEVNVCGDPKAALEAALPPAGNKHFYRITLTGTARQMDLAVLQKEFSRFQHLQLRDKTLPEGDLWSAIGEDSLEGVFFRLLHDAMEDQPPQVQQELKLAAAISRQILDGQEVTLP